MDKIATSGNKLLTLRYTNVNSTTGQALTFATAPKGIVVHYEAGNVVMTVTGNATGSAAANITDAGTSMSFPVGAVGGTVATIKAPSSTINISVFAWWKE